MALSLSHAQALETCTLVGCLSSASISIQLPNGQPPAFDVEIEFDNKSIKCSAPDPSSELSASPKYCGNTGEDGGPIRGDNVSIHVREIVACKATSESQQHEECAHPGIFEEYVRINAAPQRIKVTLRQDSRVAGERVFVPEYVLSYPNGEKCGNPCGHWATTWTVESH